MIALAPPLRARGLVVAAGAVLAAVRLGGGLPGDRGEEAGAQPPVVGADVGEADRRPLRGAEDDVCRLGRGPLDRREGLRVEAELERVLRLRRAGELRVEHLVGVRAELGGPLDPLEEVRDPSPLAEDEHGLVDVGGALPQRLLGAPRGGVEVAVVAEPELDHVVAGGAQRAQVRGLVLLALAHDQLGVRVGVVGLLPLAERDLELERGQVLAAGEAGEVGGGEAQAVRGGSHRSSSPPGVPDLTPRRGRATDRPDESAGAILRSDALACTLTAWTRSAASTAAR